MRECAIALSVYVGAGGPVRARVSWDFAALSTPAEFYAGWLTEYSLSVDNLFVFLLIMRKFLVPEKLQQEALVIGIVIAIILRGIFIALGAAVINEFASVFYIFGAVPHLHGGQAGPRGLDRGRRVQGEPVPEVGRAPLPGDHRLPRAQDRRHGSTARSCSRRCSSSSWRSGTTDLLFALDSIPAIYGLTKEPYLVLTANIFALMGLRQLYFLIGGLLKRLVYLSIGLAVLLAFIGVKLILHAHARERPAVHQRRPPHQWGTGHPHRPVAGRDRRHPGVTTIASLMKTRRDERSQVGG